MDYGRERERDRRENEFTVMCYYAAVLKERDEASHKKKIHWRISSSLARSLSSYKGICEFAWMDSS